jgi:excisionase family DNA binding protein
MREASLPTEIMTLSEAAKFIRVSEKTLGELARGKVIPCRKVGREWRFLRQALEEWLSDKKVSNGNRASLSVGNMVRVKHGWAKTLPCDATTRLLRKAATSEELHEPLCNPPLPRNLCDTSPYVRMHVELQARYALSMLSKPVVEAIMRDYEKNHK